MTQAKLVKPGEGGFLAGVLAPGMRALSIPISPLTAASGFVLPGGIVDLVLTREHSVKRPDGTTTKKLVSETMMEKLLILAIDQNVNDAGTQPRLGKTATVEVSPKDAERITLAGRMGRISLVLMLKINLTEMRRGEANAQPAAAPVLSPDSSSF